MPRMSDIQKRPELNRALCKLLLIADGKLGKSFYAASAAKAGFNVLYLNGDVATATISGMTKSQDGKPPVLTQEEASRIYMLDIGDSVVSGGADTKMLDIVDEFIKAKVIRWNDTQQRLATRNDHADEVWEIRPGLMGPNDIWVFDSWTSYTESLMRWVAIANDVDISMAKTHEMRPVYQGGGLKATEMLQVIRSMPCNVIVLGHPDEYTHTTLKEGVVKGKATEKDQVVDWTKMIAKTVSKPQGLIMPKYFTDVAWMEYSPAGTERRLNFKPHNDKVGGGHFDGVKSVDEYSFAKLCAAIGVPKPVPQEPKWLTIIPPKTEEEIAALAAATPTPSASKVLDGTKAKPAVGATGNGGGLAALMKKAAATA